MLFYLVPYIAAVVFTLVAEQVNRRSADLRQVSLGRPTTAGQGVAIAAATATILMLGAMLYLLTPQLTRPYLEWRYGQLSNIGFLGAASNAGGGGAGGGEGQTRPGQGAAASGSSATGAGDGAQGYEPMPGHGWPSPAQMRDAAKRPGMPHWQSAAILQMASLDEQIQQALAPLRDALESLWNRLKEWLEENRNTVLRALYALLVLATLAALFVLLREIKVLTWLLTRYDYLRLGILGRHAAGSDGIRQYYRAMERLFSANDLPRQPAANTREYLREITHGRDQIRSAASEMTGLFEQSRYGQAAVSADELGRMRHLYRQLFRRID